MEVLGQQQRLDARVVVISFASPASLARYRDRFDLGDATLLSDRDRAAYNAFGFGRAAAARVWLDPRVWWRYAQLIARGRHPEPLEDDALQLGGDVLCDEHGRITWIYRSRGPEDRPTIETLVKERRRGAQR